MRTLALLFVFTACSSHSSTSAADASADAPDAPSIEAGLYMAVQGTPPPAQGSPTPFILVGCPAGGALEVHPYLLAFDGTKTDLGRSVASLAKQGIDDQITLGSQLHIDTMEQGSLAQAPFIYVATVTADPAFLDVSGHSFVARMLNPDSPGNNDVGLAFPEKLVQCP